MMICVLFVWNSRDDVSKVVEKGLEAKASTCNCAVCAISPSVQKSAAGPHLPEQSV